MPAKLTVVSDSGARKAETTSMLTWLPINRPRVMFCKVLACYGVVLEQVAPGVSRSGLACMPVVRSSNNLVAQQVWLFWVEAIVFSLLFEVG